MAQVSTVNEYFETLKARFRPDQAVGVNAIFHYELGKGGDWKVVIQDGQLLEVGAGVADKPNLKIMMEPENFLKMVNGELDGAKAFMTRKLKVKGNVALAQKMRKFLPPAGE
jgi:putative sterol carrier protein